MIVTLKQGIAGEQGLDRVLDDIAICLYKQQLPNDWRRLAPDSCKTLPNWMDHLQVGFMLRHRFALKTHRTFRLSRISLIYLNFRCVRQQRAHQYKQWSVSGEPMVMWLSGLHNPKSFLTALVQVFR